MSHRSWILILESFNLKQESLNHHLDESTEEKNNIICYERASVVDNVDDTEDRKEDEEEDSEAQIPIQEENVGKQSKPAEEAELEDIGNTESFTDHQHRDIENLDLIEDNENPQTLIDQDILGELQKPSEETTLESIKHIEDSSDNLADHQTVQSVQPNKDNENLNTIIEDSEKPQMLDQQEIVRELSNPAHKVKIESNMYNEDNFENPDKDQSKDMIEPNEGTENLNLVGGDGEELIEQEDDIADMSKTTGAEAQVVIQQENAEKLPKPTEETELTSNIDIDFKSENPADHQPVESVQPNEDIENSSLIGDNEKLAEQEGGLTDTSSPIEAEENLLSSEESKEGQSLVESENLHTNQISHGPVSSAVEQVPPVEVVPVNSSPSSSPTSVLTKHMAVGEMSSASLSEMVQIDVPQSDMEAMVRSSSSDELQLNIVSIIMPHNLKIAWEFIKFAG